jgi:CO/xanthine dehydrogenase Mo-binding subunit
MRVVHTRQPRLDGVAKVTGRAKYAMDAHPKGMLWARILTAPYGRARLEKIDIEAARRVPGFKAITGDQQAEKLFVSRGSRCAPSPRAVKTPPTM